MKIVRTNNVLNVMLLVLIVLVEVNKTVLHVKLVISNTNLILLIVLKTV